MVMGVFDPRNLRGFEKYLQSQIDIVAFIGEYVSLSRKGRHYEGLCPFHEPGIEKIFSVYPGNQLFMCWSTGCSHGDVFDFVARRDGITRTEAVGILAGKLGIYPNILREIPEARPASQLMLSFSKLKLFQQCPLRYKYRYIDRQRDQKTTPYLALGRILHKSLADFFSVDTLPRTRKLLLNLLEENWQRGGYPTSEEALEIKMRAQHILEEYCDAHDCSVQTFRVEAPIKCTVSGMVVTGTVDRIDKLGTDGYEIIDYKTEHLDTTEEQTTHIQLAFYYYGVLESYGISASRLTLEYLASQDTISMTPSEDMLQLQLEKAHDIVEQIREMVDFRPTRNKYCADCVLQSTCAESAK